MVQPCYKMAISLVQHKDRLNMENIDKLTVDRVNSEEPNKHGSLLPNTLRCIISGPSNCGKTNVVFNLLTQTNGLCFNNVYIFSKSLNQPKYQLLEKVLNDVEEIGFYKYNANEDIIEPNNAKPYSIFIFDDVSCEKHDVIKTYFAFGRHNNIDSIYIGQTYSKIPKQLIRDNVNLLVVFKQDDTNLKHIHVDHVGSDMTFEKLKDICKIAWKEKYGFLVICTDNAMDNGRYRIGFDHFIVIK